MQSTQYSGWDECRRGSAQGRGVSTVVYISLFYLFFFLYPCFILLIYFSCGTSWYIRLTFCETDSAYSTPFSSRIFLSQSLLDPVALRVTGSPFTTLKICTVLGLFIHFPLDHGHEETLCMVSLDFFFLQKRSSLRFSRQPVTCGTSCLPQPSNILFSSGFWGLFTTSLWFGYS